jgi:hypothetical protein
MAIQAIQFLPTVKADSHEVFTAFFHELTNLCIWERKLEQRLSEYAQVIAGKNVNITRCIGVSEARQTLNHLLPAGSAKANFVEDIGLLVDMIGCLFDCESVGLRLSVLNRAMCPKFHTDKISGRLICTYMGSATQWLDSQYPALSSRDLIATKAQAVKQAKPGDVLLLKGEGWPDNEHNGIVHRSPACAEGESRVLLTLDPM